MKNIKVCHLTTVHKPFDDRIFHKECMTLADEGFDVVLIAQHDRDEVVDSVGIIGLPKAKTRIHRMTWLAYRAFVSAVKTKADFYHLHDPELIPIGLLLKLFTGKKVYYDVHEDYALTMLDKSWLPEFSRNSISLLVAALEKLSARAFDRIITATTDIALNFPAARVSVIRNLPLYNMIRQVEPLRVKKDRPVVIYAGGLARVRGIKELVQAVGHLDGAVEMWLLGTWETQDFREECEKSAGWQYVSYLGCRGLKEVYAYMKAADIGLHCMHPLPRYVNGLPVKYFEYLACEIPVVLSSSALWEELFRDCALFADTYSPEDIAGKIMTILSDGALRSSLVANGKRLIESEYDWEKEKWTLIDIYRRAVQGGSNV